VAAYLNERPARLREALDETSRLAAAGALPNVELNDKGLKITPLDDTTPVAADILTQQVYDLMQRVKITDPLLEVDQWTDFTRHFTHLKSDSEPSDRTQLLTALLADAFNLELEKVADACPDTSAAKLSWLVAWCIPDGTYQKGLAGQLPAWLTFRGVLGRRNDLVVGWSEIPRRWARAGRRICDAKYGNEPGVLFYTHISTSTHRSTPRSLIRQCVTQLMCSMACCITSRSCALRSTIRTPLVSLPTCLRCATSLDSSLRRALPIRRQESICAGQAGRMAGAVITERRFNQP
jgi:hypothetical protein